MKQQIKKINMKPWDFILLLSLILLSFTPWLVFGTGQKGGNALSYKAELRVNNQLIRTFNLAEDQEYTYKDEDGDVNVLEIKDNRIRMKYASCSDQICVRRGWVQKGGETIVCLPHHLVVEVVASDGSNDGSVIY